MGELTRGQRRSQRSVNGVRRTPLTVYVTGPQRALIEARAANEGVTMARVLVDAATHPGSIEGVDPEDLATVVAELRHHRRQLEGVATNLNQIAKHANTIYEVPEDFAEVLARVDATVDAIYELLARVRR